MYIAPVSIASPHATATATANTIDLKATLLAAKVVKKNDVLSKIYIGVIK